MHNIHGRKIGLTIILLCFICAQGFSQFKAKDNYNYLDFQKKAYYFGISLGLNSSGYQVNKSSNFITNDSINIVNGIYRPGFNLHIITNLKIGEYFDFRFIPGFSFTERIFEYRVGNGDELSNKSIESVFADLPFLLRFKSEPYKDKRMFVLAGVKYQYDVASNSRAAKDKAQFLVQVSPHDFSVEVGAGMQFFFPYFIFSPEIKFTQGIGNVHIYKDELLESNIMDNVLSRMISISFNFEG